MTRIMTNIAAINAQRNLNDTSLKMGKVLEQLSSGYRINRAADDAAGLGISEKMRAQIRGNQQALRNVQDGVSMLQTGEGAMDEVHSMLQRMRELAVQAANGTYADNGPERTSMGQEITQLASEIDRIANSTEFNGQKLLTGNLSVAIGGSAATSLVGSKLIGGPTVPATSALKAGATLPSGSPSAASVTAVTVANVPPGTYSFAVNGGNIEMRQGTTVIATANAANFNGGAAVAASASGAVTFSNGMTATVANPAGNAAYTFANLGADMAARPLQVDGLQASQLDVSAATPQTYTFSSPGAGALTLTGADGTTQTLSGITAMGPNETRTLQFSQLGVNITLTAGPSGFANPEGQFTGTSNNVVVGGSGATSVLQVGANVPDTLSLIFTNIETSGLGGGGFTLGGPTGLVTTLGSSGIVGTIANAHNLITAVDGAIQQLSTQRGTLGAAQNRLEHTMNSLGVAVENLSASESRIRDADISALSSEMVSDQILQQAGVAVLSQANQAPQSVLKLLQG